MTRWMGFGPELHDGGVTFRLWAPAAERVELVLLDRIVPMAAQEGWHTVASAGAGAGTHYKFRIDGKLDVPDPASHFQPEDIGGMSEVVDHSLFFWYRNDWRGRPWHEAVTLELHVGAFTPEGTYRAAIEKLDHVADAGFTAIELMPLADFAGRRNWGYDGVLLYAPDSTYGRPAQLKALIDAAHQRGLMVFLDVVYNHLGPEGNYLGRYAPQFFTKGHTPWGSAIDYRVPEVRDFAIGNALHWLRNYRFDGLRLDAVHAIVEPGDDLSILNELSRAVGEFAGASGRHIHLVLENDDNRASLLDPITDPPRRKYRAQWNDDYHHAWHALLTKEDRGYYRDFSDDPRRHLARTLGSGFAYQGETSVHRDGASRGEKSGTLRPLAFVNFIQNHDQIGNRPLGDRLTAVADPTAIEAALAVTLLAPMPPLLFMGEEWGSKAPFPFFCDFTGKLADAVREGRRQEFKEAYAKYGADIPDPLGEATFRSAVLDWASVATAQGRQRLTLIRDLLTTRRREIIPFLAEAAFGSAQCENDVVSADWRLGNNRSLLLLANLSDQSRAAPSSPGDARPIWGGAPPANLPPWSVFWSIGGG